MNKNVSVLLLAGFVSFSSTTVTANDLPDCKAVLKAINANSSLEGAPFKSVHAALKAAVDTAIVEVKGAGIGFGLDMWATINDRDGIVCAVAFSGSDRGDQWPGSRVISAEKAYTGNAYSLPGLAVSTANLYAANLDGGGFMGLQFSNLMNPAVAYGNPSSSGKAGGVVKRYGTAQDPLTGHILGGHIIFGGGFGLYSAPGTIVGGLGVSGDTACYDHAFGWIVRDALGLDHVPNPDNLIYDTSPDGNNNGVVDGFEHVDCGFGEQTFVEALPANFPVGP